MSHGKNIYQTFLSSVKYIGKIISTYKLKTTHDVYYDTSNIHSS